MKTANDTQTIDMHEPLKKRGRPATGQALSAAERKAAQRNRWIDLQWSGDLSGVPITALLDWMSRAVKIGAPELVTFYADELRRRADANDPDQQSSRGS